MNSKESEYNERKAKSLNPTQDELKAMMDEMYSKDIGSSKLELASSFTEKQEDSISSDNTINTQQVDSPKRTSSKQRKESLEEYRQLFLQTPKIEDRKPVFISREVRDSLDEIVRKLGGRRMSVSGLIENLARYHLEFYYEDVESWRKL